MSEQERPQRAANDNLPPEAQAESVLQQSRAAQPDETLTREALEQLNEFLQETGPEEDREH